MSFLWPFSSRASLPDARASDASKRREELLRAREDYDYANSELVQSVVITKNPLPRQERPALPWLVQAGYAVAKVRFRLLCAERNLRQLAPGDAGESGAPAGVARIPGEVFGLVDSLRGAVVGDIDELGRNKAIEDLRKRVVEAGDAAAESVMSVVRGNAAFPGGVKEFIGGVSEAVEVKATMDYRALVGYERLTEAEQAFIENFDSDKTFARTRVAGLNPMNLRAVTEQDLVGKDWRLTDKHLQDALTYAIGGESGAVVDSQTAAVDGGRLFMVTYPWLDKLPKKTSEDRYVFVPTAVFVVPPEESAREQAPLVPAAIWIRPARAKGEEVDESQTKLYLPGHDLSWEVAKLIVQVADGNDHEYIRHLALTHLLLEPFGIALKRNLHEDHPLYNLLIPHFEGTAFINNRAMTDLINVGGPVDNSLIAPIATAGPVLSELFAEVKFNDLFPRTEMAARGVLNAKALDFPYRDYALQLWDAVHEWTSAVVGAYYTSDKAVMSDTELQSFAEEIVTKAKLKGFGDKAFLRGDTGAPIIASREYLGEMLTMVIFTASCQHAALNFPQKIFLSFVPSWPLSMQQSSLPEPSSAGVAPEVVVEQWRAWFPPMSTQETQFSINQLLANVYHTRLGTGYSSKLSRGKRDVSEALRTFQGALRDVERVINEREKGERVPYHVLRPSEIPASINI